MTTATFCLWFLGSFGGGIIIACFFEWTLHRFVMHKPVWKFDYAFHAHAVVHHQIFRADRTYHLQKEEDKNTIPMAWWNWMVLLAVLMLPTGCIAWLLGQWSVVAGAGVAYLLYYLTYEYIHWCMHLPKSRRLEMSWVFRKLNGHHLLHHRYMHKNYNVVLPLADLCLGTLLIRSKIRFAQPIGRMIPNVQPKTQGRVPAKPCRVMVRVVDMDNLSDRRAQKVQFAHLAP
ncbi:MAG: hypothetical protein RL536_572 [Candidatus Parcubacteria bacterium]